MSKLFSKKLIAVAFFLSLATAVLHLSSQFFTRYLPVGMYTQTRGDFGMMQEATLNLGVAEKMMPFSDETMMWQQDDALNVDQRLYSTSSYSQLVVKDVSSYTDRVRAAILAQDGRVLSFSIEKYGRYNVGNISARVPSENVPNILATIKEGVVTVVTENTSIQDETGQYVSVTDQIATLQDEVSVIEADLADAENGLSDGARRKLELQLQRLQAQIKSLENSKDSVEETVQYARIDVSVADGARYFDPSARPTGWEMLEMGWGMLAALWHFGWNTALLTALYMLIWLPVTFVISLAGSALKSK